MPPPDTATGGYKGGASSRFRIPLDPSLSLSSLVAMLMAAAALVSAWVAVQKQLAAQEAELRAMKEQILITNQMTQAALARIERSVDAMQAREMNDRRNTR